MFFFLISDDNNLFKLKISHKKNDSDRRADCGITSGRADGNVPLIVLINSGRGTLRVMEVLIEEGADVNREDKHGNTVLMVALHRDEHPYLRWDPLVLLKVVKLLVENGAHVNIRDDDGETPLTFTAFIYNTAVRDIMKVLIDHGADVNAKNRNEDTSLMMVLLRDPEIARQMDIDPYELVEIVKLLIENGADLDITDELGNTALMLASRKGTVPHMETIVDMLIMNRASLNYRNKYGETALMNAAHWDFDSALELLVNAGANLDIQDHKGYTALMWKSYSWAGGQAGFEKLINPGGRRRRAKLDIQDKYGRTALIIAISWGHSGKAKILIEAGANVNIANKHRDSPLTIAAKSARVSIVKLLIEAGADLDHQNDNKDTALILASQASHDKPRKSLEMVGLLLENGAHPNIRDAKGRTAIFYAKSNLLVTFMRYKTVDYDVVDNDGNTVLDYVTDFTTKRMLEATIRRQQRQRES